MMGVGKTALILSARLAEGGAESENAQGGGGGLGARGRATGPLDCPKPGSQPGMGRIRRHALPRRPGWAPPADTRK